MILKTHSKNRYLSFRIIACMWLILSSLRSTAIEPTWDIDLGATFDNREGNGPYLAGKTYFLTNLAAEAGLRLTKNDRIAGGAVWIQPVENSIKNGHIYPTIYYRHEGNKWSFSMGMFPMSQLREPLPGFLWCDSLTYYQKNLRGALVQFNQRNGYFEAYIDWRGIQSKKQREAFNIVFHGEYSPQRKIFLTGGYAMMNHLAKTLNAGEDQYVVDNFLVNPYIGINFSHKTPLDSLVIKAGGLLTIERHRKTGTWSTPGGLWLEVVGEWKFLGLRNSLYCGGKLFPLYGEFGHLLYQGEPYFSKGFYDRLDIYGKIYRNRYVDIEAQLNFNFTKGALMFYQRLLLNINVGNLGSTESKKKKFFNK